MADKLTLMMIDDYEADHFMTKILIEESGEDLEFVSAYDGEEALEILAEAEALPDAILLDINMPRMNGHEFLKAYSEIYDNIPPVIAMLTSSEQQVDKDKTAAYESVKDYMIKPIDINKLKNILEMLRVEYNKP